mgnify:CR=1 FL=1
MQSFLLQLLRECKEVVLGAVLVKNYYLSFVEGIVLDKEKVENDLDEFEHDLQTAFKVRSQLTKMVKA